MDAVPAAFGAAVSASARPDPAATITAATKTLANMMLSNRAGLNA